MYGISADSVKKQRAFAEKLGITYSLLCDPEKEIIMTFGVLGKKKLYGREIEGIIRSTFVLNKDNRIEHVFPKVSPKKHQEELFSVLEL